MCRVVIYDAWGKPIIKIPKNISRLSADLNCCRVVTGISLGDDWKCFHYHCRLSLSQIQTDPQDLENKPVLWVDVAVRPRVSKSQSRDLNNVAFVFKFMPTLFLLTDVSKLNQRQLYMVVGTCSKFYTQTLCFTLEIWINMDTDENLFSNGRNAQACPPLPTAVITWSRYSSIKFTFYRLT